MITHNMTLSIILCLGSMTYASEKVQILSDEEESVSEQYLSDQSRGTFSGRILDYDESSIEEAMDGFVRNQEKRAARKTVSEQSSADDTLYGSIEKKMKGRGTAVVVGGLALLGAAFGLQKFVFPKYICKLTQFRNFCERVLSKQQRSDYRQILSQIPTPFHIVLHEEFMESLTLSQEIELLNVFAAYLEQNDISVSQSERALSEAVSENNEQLTFEDIQKTYKELRAKIMKKLTLKDKNIPYNVDKGDASRKHAYSLTKVTSLAVNAQHKLMGCAYADSSVRVFSLENGSCVSIIPNVSSKISCIQFDSTADDLALIADNELILVRISTGIVVNRFYFDGEVYGNLLTVDFAPDSKFLLIGTNRGTVCVLDVNGSSTKIINESSFNGSIEKIACLDGYEALISAGGDIFKWGPYTEKTSKNSLIARNEKLLDAFHGDESWYAASVSESGFKIFSSLLRTAQFSLEPQSCCLDVEHSLIITATENGVLEVRNWSDADSVLLSVDEASEGNKSLIYDFRERILYSITSLGTSWSINAWHLSPAVSVSSKPIKQVEPREQQRGFVMDSTNQNKLRDLVRSKIKINPRHHDHMRIVREDPYSLGSQEDFKTLLNDEEKSLLNSIVGK